MSNAHTRRTLLQIARSDTTFRVQDTPSGRAWVGRCLHCRTRHLLALDGTPLSAATIEHILPRHHGGTDDLRNLAIACAACNQGKGSRLDHRRADDPQLREVVAALTAERLRRWRDPALIP